MLTLKADTVLQGVLAVKAVHLARRVVHRIVPHPDIVAIGKKDHGPLVVHFLQAIGVVLGLRLPGARVFVGALGFNHGQRFAVIVPQHIVGIADAGGGGLMQHLNFKAYHGAGLPAL